MKIIKKSGRTWRFKLLRNRRQAGEFWQAGKILELSASSIEGRQEFWNLGGFDALEPLDIPEVADYICCVKVERPVPGGSQIYQAGTTVSFERDEAIALMKNAGSVRPVSNEVCDLGAFLPYRYSLPDKYQYTSKPVHLQQKDRQREEQLEREREKVRHEIAEQLGHKKKFKVNQW